MLNLTGDMLFIDKKSPPAAQRLALVAGGRAEARCRNGKSSKPGKCLKTRRVPTCPLHAVLGNRPQNARLSCNKRSHDQIDNIHTTFLLSQLPEALRANAKVIFRAQVDAVVSQTVRTSGVGFHRPLNNPKWTDAISRA